MRVILFGLSDGCPGKFFLGVEVCTLPTAHWEGKGNGQEPGRGCGWRGW